MANAFFLDSVQQHAPDEGQSSHEPFFVVALRHLELSEGLKCFDGVLLLFARFFVHIFCFGVSIFPTGMGYPHHFEVFCLDLFDEA